MEIIFALFAALNYFLTKERRLETALNKGRRKVRFYAAYVIVCGILSMSECKVDCLQIFVTYAQICDFSA